MDTGTIATAALAAIIAFFFVLGIKKIVRRFAGKEDDCCGTGKGGCAGCSACHTSATEKRRL